MKQIISVLSLCALFIPCIFSMDLRNGKKTFSSKRKIIATDFSEESEEINPNYKAILKELDPAKLWLGKKYLIKAQIAGSYGRFCYEYGIGRCGDPYVDGSRALELPKENRQAFARDPRVSAVECNNGAGDSCQALINHLFRKNNQA